MLVSADDLLRVRNATDKYFEENTHYDMSLNKSDFVMMLHALFQSESGWAQDMAMCIAGSLGVEIV
jgi:hypothetical protein